MDTIQSIVAEERNFFRIDDKLELSYRHIATNELNSPNYAFDILAINKHHDLLKALEILAKDSHEILNKIIEKEPNIANYLKLIDHKILLLTKSLTYKTEAKNITPPQLVNISESGIAFGTNEVLKINDQLRITFVLPPLLQEISLYGFVTRIGSQEKAKKFDPAYRYWVALHFTHMQNSDRQLLARYILQKQTLKYQER
jgi:hypothetical protein